MTLIPCSADGNKEAVCVRLSVCVCVLSCRLVACRHLSWQAGPSRPGAKIRPEAAPLLSSFRPGHIALPVWSVCVSVSVCFAVAQTGPFF